MSVVDSFGERGLLFVLLGGLVATFVNVLLLLLRTRGGPRGPPTTLPSVLVRAREPPRTPGPPRDSEEREYERGRIAGKRVRASTIDGILDGFVAGGLGDARILRSVPGFKLFRVEACRSCATHPNAPCEYERAFLASSLESLLGRPVRSIERACASRGARACEIEVTY